MQLIKGGNIDYLIGDYLAELTMSVRSRLVASQPTTAMVGSYELEGTPSCRSVHL